MPDPTTPAKGLTQPTVGGDSNIWGGLLNTDLSLIDTALGGTLALSISGNTTLTSTQIQNTGYVFTGTLSAAATITWPSFSGFAFINNNTSGGFSITCGISGGNTVILHIGEIAAIWSDGTNFTRAVVPRTPTRTVLTSGSGTYTTPTNATWLEVFIVGAGGGGNGNGSGGTNGTDGGNTTFGSSFLTANGGHMVRARLAHQAAVMRTGQAKSAALDIPPHRPAPCQEVLEDLRFSVAAVSPTVAHPVMLARHRPEAAAQEPAAPARPMRHPAEAAAAR